MGQRGMRKHQIAAALVGLLLTSCGGGGGSGSGSGAAQGLHGTIRLLTHAPADDEVQVPLDAVITLRFDAMIALDCMADEDTWLRVAGSEDDVPGTFRLEQGGRSVVFTPADRLRAETDYVFQLSPLTCDHAGRILERRLAFTFRTFDATPPTVVATDVTPGQTGRSRTAPLRVTFSEAIAKASVTPSTVTLRDSFQQSISCSLQVDGAVLTVAPLADLPGDRAFTLRVTSGVRDRAQNQLAATWSVGFRTEQDNDAPGVVAVWPPDQSTGISPLVQPVVTFDESMDPLTVEPASLLFQDEFGSLIAFSVHSSPDQRVLRVKPNLPLPAQRSYVLAFLTSAAAVTDVSGNPLRTSSIVQFTTGSDAVPPQLATVQPIDGQTAVSPNVTPVLSFDEPLDPAWITTATVHLLQGSTAVAAVVDQPDAATVRLRPVLPLDVDRRYTVRLVGGHGGLRDLAGNTLPTDLGLSFTTSSSSTLPGAMLQPFDGSTGVPAAAKVSIVFDVPMDPGTLTPATLGLYDQHGVPVPVELRRQRGNRVAQLVPQALLQPGAYYRTVVRGGPTGVRAATGNWLDDDLRAQFRVGFQDDALPPAVQVTLNGIDPSRRDGIVVPPLGFTIEVTASDPELSLDMGSVEVILAGPGEPPHQDEFYRNGTIDHRSLRTALLDRALAPGTWTLTARVADLSGNVGTSDPFVLTVATPTDDMLPFERTQVVWVRTDLDRDGNQRDDFADDLAWLGLHASGDPAGTNARARRLMLDAILARANLLLGRGRNGEPLGSDSVPIRLTTRQPIALPHTQIALGGLDPQGPRSRRYGDPSTGVLGRAWFDYRNSNVNDRNIANSPGLGVFPGEMFLFQAELHRQVYPSFQTLFARRFLPLAEAMGGTPAGLHAQDAVVLAPGFDPLSASSTARARWEVLMAAIDDWAAVVGTILVHEIGHSVGLVAVGPLPRGLHGDSSLHNAQSGATEVMAPSVGYEAMVSLDYSFRDINLAYLRQRLLLR